MGRVGVWLAIGALGFGACAKSEPASWAAPCFEARELESWAERYQEPCTVETDEGADGEIEERRDEVFGEDERVSTTKYENGEIAEERTEYTKSGAIRLHETYGRDGELFSREEHVFDDEGSLIRDEIDLDGDGALDIVSTYEYSCLLPGEVDPSGLRACSVSHDLDDDGDIDGTSFMISDGSERFERVIYDPYTEEIVRRVQLWLDDGATVRVLEDVGNDGSIDRIEGTDRDEEIGVTRNWFDDDADGTIDWWNDAQIKDGGRLRSVQMDREGVVRRYDRVWDGNTEHITTSYPRAPEDDRVIERRYDDAMNFIAGAWDDAPLGSLDGCVYVSYACWQR